MVAAEESSLPVTRELFTRQPQHVQSTAPIFATSNLTETHRFPIPRWKPRSGRTQSYIKWDIGIDSLYNAYGVDKTSFANSQPPPPVSNQSPEQRLAAYRALEH